MHNRGQTGVELLLVIAFVLVVALGIVLPYVESQNITNAAYVAKLSILPYIEKNGLGVKINSITPEVTNGNIAIHVKTTGNWDKYVRAELTTSIGSPPSTGCQRICSSVAALGTYSTVDLDWQDTNAGGTSPLCAPSC